MRPPPKDLAAFAVPLSGTMLVEASAGTGKTHTITSLFVRLVLEQGAPVGEILVVTFTEAATAELRDRIRRRLHVALDALSGGPTPTDPELAELARAASASDRELYRGRANQALRDLDLAAISTIHSFCLRMLQEHAFESGARFGLELMADTSLLVREVADDYWASRIYHLDPALYALREKGFELATARSLVTTFAKRPHDLPVLPLTAPQDPAALREEIKGAFDGARTLWMKHGKAVRALLHATDALSVAQGKYPTEAIDDYCAQLDDYFEGPAASVARPDGLTKLAITTLTAATKRKKTTPAHPFFDAAGTLDDLLAGAAAGLVIGLRRGAVDYVRAELPKRKQALRAQSFEDLLHSLDAALRGPRSADLRARIGARFRAALIDEFQDTDPVQYRIFRALFHGGHAALFLVGDPKQSIYAFRGADVFSYISAASDAADAAYTLRENRRSDPSLVKAVNTVFGRACEPFMLKEIAFHSVVAHEPRDRIVLPRGATAMELLLVPRPDGDRLNKGDLADDLPGMLAREISRFLASGATIDGKAVVPGDIAVLTRTNAQARNTQAELRKLQIPTTLQSDESVFESTEAEEVELLLRAILEPTRNATVRTALATAIAGLSANELLELDADETKWDRWSETFRAWQAHWDEHGFVHAYRRVLTELHAEKRLLALIDGERRMTNLLHLGELLHGASTRSRLGRTALVRWLGLMRAEERETPELGSEASELRLESDALAVKLLTIHKSKGLEFPVVYCPALWDIRLPKTSDVAIAFHDPRGDKTLTIDIDPHAGGDSFEAATEESHAESQRLLYVALTRAKHRASIVWGGINQAEHSSLAYTLHQPPSVAPESSLSAATAARYKARDFDDAALRRDLDALVAASAGTISVVDFVDADGVAYVPAEPPAIALRARAIQRAHVDTWFRVGSFTSLVSARTSRASLPSPEAHGRDRDEVEERASLFPPTSPAPAPHDASTEPVVLHAFPRGAKPGTMIHSILEEHDFRSADDGALPRLVASKLAAAGYSNDEWGDVLVRGLRAMLATPLDDDGLTLSSLSRDRRVDELEFVFPVARGNAQLTASALAKAFAAHGGAQIPKGYPERVRTLGFLPLRGFLRGFVDLVFEHEGRFYVVDYKSNHLGDMREDYSPARLVDAMTHHDYFLQYHLYVVALHRWLGRRMRAYGFDRHFGGVLYLFARGMAPEHPLHTGVFRDRPSRALVEALSEAADG